MTLEERLLKRLRLWQSAARMHRQCQEEIYDEDNIEWTMHRLEAEVFERCIAELAVDLSARSSPSPASTASVR